MTDVPDGEIRWLGDVQRLELRPDDILVLSTQLRLSVEAQQRLRARMIELVPGHICIVLEEGLKLGLLSPAQSDD